MKPYVHNLLKYWKWKHPSSHIKNIEWKKYTDVYWVNIRYPSDLDFEFETLEFIIDGLLDRYSGWNSWSMYDALDDEISSFDLNYLLEKFILNLNAGFDYTKEENNQLIRLFEDIARLLDIIINLGNYQSNGIRW